MSVVNLDKEVNGPSVTVKVGGRVDTSTAPQFEKYVKDVMDGIEELVLDMSSLQYISSAGLRVLLAAQKAMNKQGRMVIRNANDEIMEIFDVTGFVDILTIE